MCEFLSWIEVGKDIFFLTSNDLHSSKGRKLKKHLGTQFENDIKGHGAIAWYYDMPNKGTHRECVDFSSPDNFPPEIVAAIKAGKFRGIGIAKRLLTAPAFAEYNKVTAPAFAEYNKVKDAAFAEYNKVKDAALAEYNKLENDCFWDLFADPKNRITAWR